MIQTTQAQAASAIIATRQLALHFDGGLTRALDSVDICIRENEFVAITGPSGCGKSSLLNLIGSLDEPSHGDILFRGDSYKAMADKALFRREQIGFVFQSFHLIPTLTALDNVLVPTIGRDGNFVARAQMLLSSMGLGERMLHRPAKLSGGERQRVAIARALINEPAILLADEPTGSLDSANAAQVLELIADIRSQQPLTIIMVTHDAGAAAKADREIRMRDGKVAYDSGEAA